MSDSEDNPLFCLDSYIRKINTLGMEATALRSVIILQGNSTKFKGNTDMNINGKPAFIDVPVDYIAKSKSE